MVRRERIAAPSTVTPGPRLNDWYSPVASFSVTEKSSRRTSAPSRVVLPTYRHLDLPRLAAQRWKQPSLLQVHRIGMRLARPFRSPLSE